MKHKILKESIIDSNEKDVALLLIAENEFEFNAITNLELSRASDNETELVYNYVGSQFGWGNYSIVEFKHQEGNVVFINVICCTINWNILNRDTGMMKLY